MDKQTYKNSCLKIIEGYELTNKQTNNIISQMNNVLNDCDTDDLFTVLGSPKDFIDELLELNEIPKVVKNQKEAKEIKPKKELHIFSRLAGVLIIVAAFVYAFTDYSIYEVGEATIYTLIGLYGLSLLTKKSFFWGLVWIIIGIGLLIQMFVITFLNSTSIFSILVVILALYIGLKLIFRKKKPKLYNYSNEYKQRYNTGQYTGFYIINDTANITNKSDDIRKDLSNEKFKKVVLTNKLGSTYINLSNFDFPLGDIEIQIYNSLGNVELILPEDCNVLDSVMVKGGQFTINRPLSNSSQHTIKITGQITYGEATIN